MGVAARAALVTDRPLAGLRLTRRQRDLLREGLFYIRPQFEDDALWQAAIKEAADLEARFGLVGFTTEVQLWLTNMAALACGAWWLLMPGCGSPLLQTEVCARLSDPFECACPQFVSVADHLSSSPHSALVRLLDAAERVRCMLYPHVRES